MNIAGIAALRFVDMETALNASRVLTVTAATVRTSGFAICADSRATTKKNVHPNDYSQIKNGGRRTVLDLGSPWLVVIQDSRGIVVFGNQMTEAKFRELHGHSSTCNKIRRWRGRLLVSTMRICSCDAGGRNPSGDGSIPMPESGSSPDARSVLLRQLEVCEQNKARWIQCETALVRELLTELVNMQKELEIVSKMADRADARQISSRD